jgi:hypothetical protein
MDDFLIIMGTVMVVCLSGAAWALWSLRSRESKRGR